MYPELDAIFRRYLSGTRAQRTTAALTEHYRSPGSSGYHAATRLVASAIQGAGADEVTEERYPLDGKTKFLGRTMPPAWEPLEASLDIVEPSSEHLISYRETPSTLPWWCNSTPSDGVVVQVIDVGRGLSAADYAGKPIAGSAVLIRDSESRPAWHHAAELARSSGAVGIITDFLHSQTPPWRTRVGLPEAVQLLRLPPRWENLWAFSVDYHAAQRLSILAQAGPVRVRAHVRTRTFAGEGVNLLATIRGAERPEESVLFIAHTSAGTKPCANCAAGPALMIELCRAIQTAVREGVLPRPRRSIRFLFVAEGLGSTYFIHSYRDTLPMIKAALCLDSVGHRQATLKSSLVMYRSPDSIPSFINDVGAALIEDLPAEAEWPFRGGPAIPLVNFHQLPYTPWSDNHYWVTFGVPAPLFMSWPDRYFHTQLLTADHTDPMVFERAGRVLGSLAMGIARAGAPEALAVVKELSGRSAFRLTRLIRQALVGLGRPGAGADGTANSNKVFVDLKQHVQFVVDRDVSAIRSAITLADGGAGTERLRAMVEQVVTDLRRHASVELDRLEGLMGNGGRSRAAGDAAAAGARREDTRPRADNSRLVPRRGHDGVAPGVVGLSYDEMADLVDAMRAEDPAVNWETLRIFGDELWNFADGHRTLGDISEAICFEFGFHVDARHFLTLARDLQKAGLFHLEG